MASLSPGNRKALATVHDHHVSPRFDMTLEVVIAEKGPDGEVVDEKHFLLPEPSAEEICTIIQNERIHDVICGGIEDAYCQYLEWKKVKVYYNVIGPVDQVIRKWRRDSLSSDMIFRTDKPV